MADLTRRSTNRGQLLIITALGIALLLVLLAMALNTAVFGEVHVASTDDTLHEERTAVQYEESLERGVQSMIPRVNDNTSGNYTELRYALAGEISNWTDLTAERYAAGGASTNVTLETVHFRTDVTQDTSRNFTNASTTADWTVAENVSTVDEYEMNITQSNLVNTSDCASAAQCFNLSVDGGAWRLSAHETGGKAVIRVDAANGENAKCEATGDFPVTVNVTNGSFDHPECSGETFTPFQEDTGLTSPHTLTYVNADNVSGTYNISADGRFDETNYHSANSSKSPRFDPRIDAANVSVTYRSSELLYRNERRIEAGDADD